MSKQKVIANEPWLDPKWEPADASAIQALFRGDADKAQQQRAINFIVSELCVVPYSAYDAKNQRNTDFALGKQRVGHLIVRLNRLNVGQFTGDKRD